MSVFGAPIILQPRVFLPCQNKIWPIYFTNSYVMIYMKIYNILLRNIVRFTFHKIFVCVCVGKIWVTSYFKSILFNTTTHIKTQVLIEWKNRVQNTHHIFKLASVLLNSSGHSKQTRQDNYEQTILLFFCIWKLLQKICLKYFWQFKTN